MTREVTIIGQGYVGLPLAKEAAAGGWRVHGLDVNEQTSSALNEARSHVDDVSDADVAQMIADGYRATTDPEVISRSSVVVVCVPTPLGDGGGPDLAAVRASAVAIGANLAPGSLIILESTTYPGTTENVLVPIIEAESGREIGTDFDVAFSPERVNPGDAVYGIKNTPKLVGGVTSRASERAVEFYSSFIDTVVALSGPKEAETAKLLENTFRHVNIALVNEMTTFCHEMGIDIWEVIRGAATKPFGFMEFTPGPGVGGHCIPIDPNYLAYEVRSQLGYPFRFVELAQEINNSMPNYVATRITLMLNELSKSVKGSKILILGVTYKPDIADQRESPSVAVADRLRELGADVEYHDPYVEEWALSDTVLSRVRDLDAALTESDLTVLLQAHSSYDLDSVQERASQFFDTRGKTAGVRL